MKSGFTTGSCAAAATKAATMMLLGGGTKSNIEIITPAGISYAADVLDITRDETMVSCAVKKDAGDDPDVTNGILIYAKVEYLNEDNENTTVASDSIANNNREQADIVKEAEDIRTSRVLLDGGIGIGRVTKKGLSQNIGEAAINETPRKMIIDEAQAVMDLYDYDGKLKVTISAPDGVEIAKKTFNERLGIVGGISVLGTSGIVEPMSQKAIIDTIRIEMKQRRCYGEDTLVVTPGNYGRDFIRDNYGYDLEKAVKISNFIGNSIDIAIELGYKKLLLAGHIGKLVKIAGGIMNTHSREADCRMEILASAAIQTTAPKELAVKILSCVSTDAALEIAKEYGYDKQILEYVFEKIMMHLDKRAEGKIKIECLLFSNEYGVLGMSEEAEKILKA